MRIFDDYGLKMCAFQGNLFEKSLTAVKCSSPVFLRRFMFSKTAEKMDKPGELRKLYYPYHSLDPAQAVERIMEAKGLTEPDDIQRGVEILRRIRMQNKVAERGMNYGK